MSDESTRPTEEDVRAALDRITQSGPFRVSPRSVSLLRFVVEAELAGEGPRIKGFTIATGALGRSEAFDPATDAIVRVAAARVRRALDRYYEAEGADDPIAIEIPRGRYVPVYRRRLPLRAMPGSLRQRAAAIVVPRMQRVALRLEAQIRRCRAVAGFD